MGDDAKSWEEQLAARITRQPRETAAGPAVVSKHPAWARTLADRATGQEPSAELLAEAQRAAGRPRTEMEQRILERLGFDEDGTPPAA